MSVIYRGLKPERNFSTADFYSKGIILTQYLRSKTDWNRKHGIKQWTRFVFMGNGLQGVIRHCGNTWAVDYRKDWHTGDHCLTTECKTLKEAKSILYTWFASEGFHKAKCLDWKDQLLFFPKGYQIKFNPIIYR